MTEINSQPKLTMTEEEEIAQMFDLTNKKKSKKKKQIKDKDPLTIPLSAPITIPAPVVAYSYSEPPINDFAGYSYEFMADRLFQLKEADAKKITKKIIIPHPVVTNAGKKTTWSNFDKCVTNIGRIRDHVKQFMLSELSTTGTITSNYCFIIAGKYNQKQIQDNFTKYIAQYVQCDACKKLDSYIGKESITATEMLFCNDCGARRPVKPISNGFRATTKQDRRLERQK